MPAAAIRHWAALPQVLYRGPVAFAALGRFALRTRFVHLRAFRQALSALATGAGLPAQAGPFSEVHPHVLELRRSYLRGLGHPVLDPSAPVVIHLNGTGEPLLSVLPGLWRLLAQSPGLASHRHLFVDMPHAAGTYRDADAFRDVLRDVLSPVLEEHAGGLVLFGLSRGAMAALDLGASWAETLDRPVGVIAMSAPLLGDYPMPTTVRDIACMQPLMAHMQQLASALPDWYLRGQDWLLRRCYLALTCFTMAEFGMADGPVIRAAARDVAACDPVPAILRANREFAMLLQVDDARLLEGMRATARSAARNPQLTVRMLWGERDGWVPAERCATRAQVCFEVAAAPADQVQVAVLPGWGHAMGRQLDQDFAALAAHVTEVCQRVAAGQGRQGSDCRSQRARALAG